jgi:hypothetical protein
MSLTLCLKMLLQCEGGERGSIEPHGLHTIVNRVVPDGWHTTVAALIEFTGMSPLSVTRTFNKTTGCLFLCLQGAAAALPCMAIPMFIK